MKQYKSFLIDYMYPQGNDHISHLSAKRKIINSKQVPGGKGYVSSQEGNTLITCRVGSMTMNLETLNHALVEEHFLNGIYIYIYIYIHGVCIEIYF